MKLLETIFDFSADVTIYVMDRLESLLDRASNRFNERLDKYFQEKDEELEREKKKDETAE